MDPHPDIRLSEADVQAFTDGLLASERAKSLHAYLASRPDEARRVAFYDRLNTQLRSMFDNESVAPMPGHRQMGLRLRLWTAIVACLLLVIAGIGATVRVPDAAFERAALSALAMESTQSDADTKLADAPDLSSAGFHAVDVRSITLGAFSTVKVIAYRNANNDPLVLLSTCAPPASMRSPWHAHRIGTARLIEWTSMSGVRTIIGSRAGTPGLMLAADLLMVHQNMQRNEP
ncbi:Anti-sigma factor [Burkholderia sp. 8Y]|uniref:anti-sigma factor family protein n=1 Tax=Burkholderia sp. 8Y TaxID=2653133 RepID=UPI0012F1D5E4|nr:transcriptional regulator [Burkholderia sp. 8Y]VXC74068.1 Anti-sigma factor [Burkholderia sp. 8Y]